MLRPDEKNIALVVNPLAGSGSSIPLAARLLQRLVERGIPCQQFLESWPAHWESFTDIWVVGGDGTINYFLNRYPNIKLPITIFNGGSGNDLFRSMHGKRTEAEMLETGLQGALHQVDAARCNDRILINAFGIGFDGAVAFKSMKNRKLMGSYFHYIIREIFAYHSITYTMDYNNQQFQRPCFMINLMNGENSGGGYKVAPGAKLDDGLFQLLIVKPINILTRLRFLTTVMRGKHLNLTKLVSYEKTAALRISSTEIMHAHIDGEYMAAREFNFTVLPGRFTFRY